MSLGAVSARNDESRMRIGSSVLENIAPDPHAASDSPPGSFDPSASARRDAGSQHGQERTTRVGYMSSHLSESIVNIFLNPSGIEVSTSSLMFFSSQAAGKHLVAFFVCDCFPMVIVIVKWQACDPDSQSSFVIICAGFFIGFSFSSYSFSPLTHSGFMCLKSSLEDPRVAPAASRHRWRNPCCGPGRGWQLDGGGLFNQRRLELKWLPR